MLRLEEEDIYAGIATSGSGGGDTPESAKGSFNASTQQLTLKYDYLVEKINSSTVLTDAQKTTAIAELNNSDVVVSMTTSIMPENEYMYGFQASSQVGLFVDVATPVTLKMVVVPSDTSAVISTIGTYKAIADFNTFMGDPMTEEQAEEQYAPLIVDENLCTVSGTLGNFEVEFIEDAPITEKYGATISNFLGDVDSNGVLQVPSESLDAVFTGVKDLAPKALSYAFYCSTVRAFPINSITFPDLETISGEFAIQYMCGNSAVTSASFPKLKSITAQNNSMAFGYCYSLTSISLPEIETIKGANSMFNNCTSLTSINLPKLKQVGDRDSNNGATSLFGNCSSVTQINLPLLEKIGWAGLNYGFTNNQASSITFPALTTIYYQGLQRAFQGCRNLTSLSFPALTSTFNYWEGNSYDRNYSWDNMLNGVTGCTVHFPSNLQSVIENDTAVTAGFGGTNTTVLFDLPATE